jgi:hypothetical protein
MTTPPVIHSDVDPVAFEIGFGVLAAITVVLCVREALRLRDVLPVAVLVGALVCALNEPIFDFLGKIVYAEEATTAYTAFGRDIPLFLVIGYIPWVGALPYVIARLMAGGVSRAKLHAIALGSFLSVVVVESIGTSIGAWAYYGDPPLKWLGVAPMMAPVPIVCGLLLYAIGSRVHGWRRGVLFAVPCVSLPLVYAACGFPMYVALYSDVPESVEYVAGLATLALCAAFVGCATKAAELWRTHLEPAPDRPEELVAA